MLVSTSLDLYHVNQTRNMPVATVLYEGALCRWNITITHPFTLPTLVCCRIELTESTDRQHPSILHILTTSNLDDPPLPALPPPIHKLPRRKSRQPNHFKPPTRKPRLQQHIPALRDPLA
jgi:hypothetical protein